MAQARVLDVEKAIAVATDLFWEKGYEGTSLADLTTAMGVKAPSFYFAFGSKEGLFERVLEHYDAAYMRYASEALLQPTARAVVEFYLYRMADALTDPAHPPGCLAVNSALPCANDGGFVRNRIAKLRETRRDQFMTRFEAAKADGDLPADADSEELTRFIMTVGWGMAGDAQSGATRENLYATAARALKAWPTER